MADPICRWRNPYLKTIRELIDILPKSIMPSSEARIIINQKWNGDFFHTPYQLACQLSLYSEHNDTFFPRFNETPSIEDLMKYLRKWILQYYIPNPYTKKGFSELHPNSVHSSFCNILHEEQKEVNWADAKNKVFMEQIGNDDILINTINKYSDLLLINKGWLKLKDGVQYEDLQKYIIEKPLTDRNDKEAFFNHFNNIHKPIVKLTSQQNNFNSQSFIKDTNESGLIYSKKLINRFIASLITKPFVILSGLSGSGKTKMAQAFAQWICEDVSQYCIVPVGADWTNREPLLGYPNALKTDEYIKPDNGVLDLIIEANNNSHLPYFLILDEMNLSHVERYFADFLSVMESKGNVSLFSECAVNNGVPAKLNIPSNLFIIGTVNIDETTYMFSPKVLDRANAIEFRVTKDEINDFFSKRIDIDMQNLNAKGGSMAASFLKLAMNKKIENQDSKDIQSTLVSFFEQLKKTGAEFGYRSANEIIRLINQLSLIDSDLTTEEKLDIAIVQKLLPKLHGSRRKLCPVLKTLGNFCINKDKINDVEENVFAEDEFDFSSDGVKYPLSLEKIYRMYKGAIDNGFASYAEA